MSSADIEFDVDDVVDAVYAEDEETTEDAPKPRAQAGFFVIIGENGRPIVYPDAVIDGIDYARKATQRDVLTACSEIVEDLRIAETAQMAARITAEVLLPKPEPTPQERLQQRLQQRREQSGGCCSE